jgi:dihydroorotate dehydrogenase
VGLAAGFDRDGSRLDGIVEWGVGFAELGTVTPAPVTGHNPGARALAEILQRRAARGGSAGAAPVIGVSLGVQPGSSSRRAGRDYAHGMEAVWTSAHYLVLNFTSRAAQRVREDLHRDVLLAILAQARAAAAHLAASTGHDPPVLVKWRVGPALHDAVSLAQSLRPLGYAGMVAAFDADMGDGAAWEDWVPRGCGVLINELGPTMPLIAVGGIATVERALALQRAGAALLQLYRPFAQQGPALVRAITAAWNAERACAGDAARYAA